MTSLTETSTRPLHPPRPKRRRLAVTLDGLSVMFTTGESNWTPFLVVVVGYAITIPALVVILGLSELAYYLG
jgi:hypothetical protein